MTSYLLLAVASLALPAQQEGSAPGSEFPPVTEQDTLLLEIGVVHGDPNQIFGRIGDLEVDEHGNILVLDVQSYAVSWFSPDGEFRDIVGREGDGPGEFRYPVGMAIGPHGNVHVLDGAHRRISVFELGDPGFRLLREIKTGLFATDMCVEGDDIVVLGEVPGDDTGPILHVISPHGNRVRSFGGRLPFVLAPEMRRHRSVIAETYARGFVHCSGSGMVVVGSSRLGVIRSFSIEGDAQWHTELDSFSLARWVAIGAAVQRDVDPNTGFTSTLSHISGGYEGQLVVSVHEGSMKINRRAVGAIDAGSGAESTRKPYDMVVATQVGDRVYGFVRDPFPKVMVRRVRPGWLN